MLRRFIEILKERKRNKLAGQRLFELADRKNIIKAKEILIEADRQEMEVIDREALTYLGKGWGRDLFIKCLVENLHFESVNKTPDDGDLYCDSCNCTYVLKPDNVTEIGKV